MDAFVPIVRNWIENYDPNAYRRTEKDINDGISAKVRHLIIPTWQEEIISNVVAIVLRDAFMSSMYEHSYSSIPKRGTHKATKYISKWLRKDCVNTRFGLQMDIVHYFDSVDQELLLDILRRRIKDKHFLDLWAKLLSTADHGLPLGFPSSQWFANIFLDDLDHFVKEKLHVSYYVRFSDDLIIFADNKEILWAYKFEIEKFLANKKLTLKSNWQIFPVDTWTPNDATGRVLDFLGYKHHRDYVTMRKKVLLKFDRKIRHVMKKESTNIKDARQIITYAGYLTHAQCYTWFKKHVSNNINLRYLRIKISKYSKKECKGKCGIQQKACINLS